LATAVVPLVREKEKKKEKSIFLSGVSFLWYPLIDLMGRFV
jgi:hypothetical protein